MGCGSPKEKLEDEMMVYKLERMDIQMQKEKELKKLEQIEGHVIERSKIPDYIDPQFAKEKRLYPMQPDNKDNDNENNENSKKTKISKKPSKKSVDNVGSKNKKKKK